MTTKARFRFFNLLCTLPIYVFFALFALSMCGAFAGEIITPVTLTVGSEDRSNKDNGLDFDGSTLTLSGVNMQVTGAAAITITGDVAIVLKGDNLITSKNSGKSVSISGNAAINGTGKLEIGNTDASGSADATALDVGGKLTVESGYVYLHTDNTSSATALNCGSADITGGYVRCEANTTNTTGNTSTYGIHFISSFIVSGGRLEVNAAAASADGSQYGILGDGDVTARSGYMLVELGSTNDVESIGIQCGTFKNEQGVARIISKATGWDKRLGIR